MKKVSLVSSSLGNNLMIRVYPFTQLLKKEYNLEVIGPVNKEIYPPLKNEKIKIKAVKEKRVFPFYLQTLKQCYNSTDGDIIHAFKPKIYSYGLAMLKKYYKKKPIILDIDDWESQYVYDNYLTKNPISWLKFMLVDGYFPESYFSKKLMEYLRKYSDAVVVDCLKLQKLFGGTYIPSGADTDNFNPSKANPNKTRKELNINKDDIVLGFIGTPRKHKGMDELIKAFHLAKKQNPNIKLLIVGGDEQNYYHRKLKNDKNIILKQYVSHNQVPDYISAADIIPMPQKTNPSAMMQTPYKIYEMMAMAKPIISTSSADMPIILKDCGKIIKPNNIQDLKQAILNYSEDKQLRKKHGLKARQKCIKEYSWKIMKKKTKQVYEKVTS